MIKDTLGLFGRLSPDATKTKQDEIKRLRALALHYLDEHNALVSEYWRLDILLTETTDEAVKREIETNKNHVAQEMAGRQYDEKHLQAIESAKALEIELYGYSELNNGSFYAL